MNQVARDFVSNEPRTFRVRFGRVLASSLSGFLAGIVVASLIWLVGIWYVSQLQSINSPKPPVIPAPASATK